jgi:hypothetical protein
VKGLPEQVGVNGFLLAMTCGAALLALWIMARYTDFGPRSVGWAIVHVVIACVVLKLLPYPLEAIRASGIPAVAYVEVFGVALPLFVYAFLSGGWVGRAALGLLRR